MYTHEEIRIVRVKFSTFGWAYVVFLILQAWYKKKFLESLLEVVHIRMYTQKKYHQFRAIFFWTE